MDTNGVAVLNHEWTRMDTNEMGCWTWMSRMFNAARALARDHRGAPLAPRRREGPGVRGEGHLGFRCFEPRMDTNEMAVGHG